MTGTIKKTVITGAEIRNADFNDLPSIIASYGAWGGNNNVNPPFPGAGYVVLTIPAIGSSYQAQLAFSTDRIAFRLMSYEGNWSNWRVINAN